MNLIIKWLEWLLADVCPTPLCPGHVHFLSNGTYEGEPAAFWGCDRCDCQVVHRATKPDLIIDPLWEGS